MLSLGSGLHLGFRVLFFVFGALYVHVPLATVSHGGHTAGFNCSLTEESEDKCTKCPFDDIGIKWMACTLPFKLMQVSLVCNSQPSKLHKGLRSVEADTGNIEWNWK